MDLHYVYYAIQKDGTPKVGATSQPINRFRYYQSAKLLEVYDCPWKCGDREIELQVKYFGKRDNSTHYALMLTKGPDWKNKYEHYVKTRARGEVHGNTTLIKSQVSEIKKLYRTYIKGIRKNSTTTTLTRKDLANMYNVSLSCIRDICEEKTWKHVK